MPQIFEEHDGIVKEKTAEYQKALKLRRERFVEELEAYNHQVLSIKITLKLYLLVKIQNNKLSLNTITLLLHRLTIFIHMEMWRSFKST